MIHQHTSIVGSSYEHMVEKEEEEQTEFTFCPSNDNSTKKLE